MAQYLNKLNKEERRNWYKIFKTFCKTGVWNIKEDKKESYNYPRLGDIVAVKSWTEKFNLTGDDKFCWVINEFIINEGITSINLKHLDCNETELKNVLFDEIEPKGFWDDKEFDATDFAHPAWHRGVKYSAHQAAKLIADILSDKDDCSGRMYEPLETMRDSVYSLKLNYEASQVEIIKLKQEIDGMKKYKTIVENCFKIINEADPLIIKFKDDKNLDKQVEELCRKLNLHTKYEGGVSAKCGHPVQCLYACSIQDGGPFRCSMCDLIEERNKLKLEVESCFNFLNLNKPNITIGSNLSWEVENLSKKLADEEAINRGSFKIIDMLGAELEKYKTQLKIESKNCDKLKNELKQLNENIKLFKEYSYYVGVEIICNRIPDKFETWLNSR